MSKALSAAEIQSQFAGEWVLVGDPETDEAFAVQSGEILHHSKDRDEVYRQALLLRPTRFAVLYTGKLPDDTAIVL